MWVSAKLLEGAEGGDVAMLYTDMQFGAHREAVALFRTFAEAETIKRSRNSPRERCRRSKCI